MGAVIARHTPGAVGRSLGVLLMLVHSRPPYLFGRPSLCGGQEQNGIERESFQGYMEIDCSLGSDLVLNKTPPGSPTGFVGLRPLLSREGERY